MQNSQSVVSMCRPLVVRFGALGDMMLLGAAIRELSWRYQSPVDIITSGDWATVVLEGQPGVGTVYRINSRKTPFWLSASQWWLVHQLKQRAAGPVWFLDPSSHGLGLLKRAAIPSASIVTLERHDVASVEHIVAKTGRVIRQFPVGFPPLNPGSTRDIAFASSILALKPSWKSDLAEWLVRQPFGQQKLILFQVGNSVTTRRGRISRASNFKFWSLHNWAKVIEECARQYPEHALLLLGQPSEFRLNQKIMQIAQSPRLYNVANVVPLSRLVALCNVAQAMISVDTGPAHIGAAVGLPMVVLFGPARSVAYKPLSALGSQVLCVDTPTPPYLRHLEVKPVLDALGQLRLKETPLL
jgi:ADP-heptose:LPS heptosyltransferase